MTNINNYSKKFLQKIIFYVDTTMINLAASESADSNKILVGAITNIRDSIFSELIKDNMLYEENQKKELENQIVV